MLSFTILIGLLVICLLLVAGKLVPIFLTRYRWRKQLDGKFPHWPISWITGNLTQISSLQDLMGKTQKFVDDGAKAYIWWLGPTRCIVSTCHPDTVKVLLRSSQPKAKGGGGYDFLKPWIGLGLLTSEGSKWERNRHLLTPAFHFEILKDYVSVYNNSVEVFMDKMEKASRGEKFVEVTKPLMLVALDTLLRCSLSYQDDIQIKGDSHSYVKAVKRLSYLVVNRAMKLHLYLDWVYHLTREGQEFRHHCQYVHKFATDIIQHRRLKQLTEDESGGKRRLDFLDILLTAKDDEDRGLTDTEIRDEVGTFLFAGHDTTSTVLGWCLYALGKHPEIQQRVFEDVERVMGHRKEVLWEDLGNFRYLPLFIRETMRLYTPVPLISRQLETPVELDGVEIPKGVVIDINISQLHKNKHVWDHPEEFNPNRFDKETFYGKDPYLFVPFSAGPRNCIGQNFAMNEIKTMVACIVQRFSIEADPDLDPEPYPEVTLRTRNGIHIKFIPRSA